jgi:hypothetical protein
MYSKFIDTLIFPSVLHRWEKAALILRVKICAPLNLQPKSTIFTVKYIVFPSSLDYTTKMMKKYTKTDYVYLCCFQIKAMQFGV